MRQTLRALLLAIAFAVASAASGWAQEFDVAPTRLVLNEAERSGAIRITNRADTPLVFRFGWTFYAMNQAGTLIEQAELGQEAAAHLRYGPRALQANPGETVTVRVALDRRVDFSGERRAHLRISATPPAPVAGPGFSAEIGVTLAYDVPVLTRVGDIDEGAVIADYRAVRDQNGLALEVAVERTGEDSFFGDLRVEDSRGVLAEQVGFAVYETTPVRVMSLRLDREPQGNVRFILSRDGEVFHAVEARQ